MTEQEKKQRLASADAQIKRGRLQLRRAKERLATFDEEFAIAEANYFATMAQLNTEKIALQNAVEQTTANLAEAEKTVDKLKAEKTTE